MSKGTVDQLAQKKRDLKRILETIERIPDNNNITSIRQLVLQLNRLLRVKPLTPPTAELMIWLQERKPTLYRATKRAIFNRSHLSMLFEIKGDAALAERRYHAFLRTLKEELTD